MFVYVVKDEFSDFFGDSGFKYNNVVWMGRRLNLYKVYYLNELEKRRWGDCLKLFIIEKGNSVGY